MITYKQCELRKDNTVQTAWIPSRLAIQDKVIKLQNDDKTWCEGWLVYKVYDLSLSEKYLQNHSQDHKKMRKATDI